MTGHLERTLVQAKDEVEKHTDETLDKQKYYASEKAMAKMDKYSRQEVLDNDWLKKEVSCRNIHLFRTCPPPEDVPQFVASPFTIESLPTQAYDTLPLTVQSYPPPSVPM